MVHYIDKPALLYATTYVLQLVVIHTSEEAEEDALFGNSARVRGLKIVGHWSVYSCHRNFELTLKDSGFWEMFFWRNVLSNFLSNEDLSISYES